MKIATSKQLAWQTSRPLNAELSRKRRTHPGWLGERQTLHIHFDTSRRGAREGRHFHVQVQSDPEAVRFVALRDSCVR